MNILFILLILIFNGCGEPSTELENPVYIDHSITISPDIKPYIERYETLTGIKVTGISFNFTNNLSTNEVGRCTKYSDGRKIILILKSYWDQLTIDGYRKQLVYHEIGHCLLNLDHDNRVDSLNLPISIMYYSNFYISETNEIDYLLDMSNMTH